MAESEVKNQLFVSTPPAPGPPPNSLAVLGHYVRAGNMEKEQFLSKLKIQAKEFLDPEGGLCTFALRDFPPTSSSLCQASLTFDCDCSEGPHKHRAICSSALVNGQVAFRNSCYGCVLHREFLGTHCSSCFKREDEVLELKQCSGCKQTRYCSRACQQFDWNEGGHSRECKHLVNYTVLPSPQVNNLRLLIRVYFITYLKKKRTVDQRCHTHTHCPGVVACGRGHFLRMSTASGVGEFKSKFDGTLEQEMANDVLLQAAHVLMQPEGEEAVNFYDLLGLYARFNTNNFGIFNDLHQVIGSGVYPMTAILNHSCCPNIILTYQPLTPISTSDPTSAAASHSKFPISQGVYCLSHPSESGQELVHSYVDLCYPVLQRRRDIFESYNFNCECQRCVEQLEIYSGEWKWTAAEDELVAKLESLVDKPLLLKVVLAGAKESPSMADTDSSPLRLHAVTERISSSSLSPLSFAGYKQNCRNFESSLANFAETGDKHAHLLPAIRLCNRIISALAVFLSHVSFHPLLGLQLFTLGDLLSAAGEKDEASRYYTWCEAQLQHTHAQSPLLLRLKEAIHQNLTT